MADFATLSDERKSGSKIIQQFNTDKERCVRTFEGLTVSKSWGFGKLIFWLPKFQEIFTRIHVDQDMFATKLVNTSQKLQVATISPDYPDLWA